MRCAGGLILAATLLSLSSCGRSETYPDFFEPRERPVPQDESCNGLDEDLDGSVDEDWRDAEGRYVAEGHCGACNQACAPSDSLTLSTACVLLDENPICGAVSCIEGFAVDSASRCVPAFEYLCLGCVTDADCGSLPTALCEWVGTENRCTVGCEVGCPDGYECNADRCEPVAGSCSCDPGENFTLACALLDPSGERCVGSSLCDDGTLLECIAPDEVCDEVDNDCNGFVDDGFRDERGAYSLDIRNCGECGVDCTTSTVPEGDLICGGDPFAPTCVLDCPDARDGIDPGDRIDADRDIATGCECTVTALLDDAGPVFAEGEDLDVNCDGADGIVVRSFYVAPDGDDTAPGSPTRPLRTIGRALERAAESLSEAAPRPHIFVASGSYSETLDLPDGVFLHGGYRRDYLALDPTGFRVEVRAPFETEALGGAALVTNGAGRQETIVEWMTFQGLDARDSSSPAFGAVLRDPGQNLTIRSSEIRAGVGGAGMPGLNGGAGSGPMAEAEPGDSPRGALESAGHDCLSRPENQVRAGPGGFNRCGSVTTNGGGGGAPSCPTFADRQPNGMRGQSASGAAGGGGGSGGQDSRGPVVGSSCSVAVCCGLADFSVPSEFTGPQSGSAGDGGSSGGAGGGCGDALGNITVAGGTTSWTSVRPGSGTSGTPGAGGGGGGAGGGAEMEWFDGPCGFPDGLGGGGGGGGAGGCGGNGGTGGTSGGPSVAILLQYTAAPRRVLALSDVILRSSDGGRGGDGGAGGDGGLGGTGAFGGSLLRSERTTPTLSGPFPGARGGRGGDGGAGGAGGGGCGGSTVGVWVTGVRTNPPGLDLLRSGNSFLLGRAGSAGRGGGGGAPAADGAEGGVVDVIVR